MSFTVYKSSAGSGKTFTLVKEYLKIALSTEAADKYRQILAITFTNKAASEMKERVISSLKALSSDNALSGSTVFLLKDLIDELKIPEEIIRKRAEKVLQSILHNYSDFNICTIDKFVHKIIRSFAHDLRIPLNFNIELDGHKLLKEAIDLVIAKVGTDEKLTRALVEYTESKADDEKSWNLEYNLLKFAKTLLNEDGLEHLNQLKNLTINDFFTVQDQVNTHLHEFKLKVSGIGKEALQCIESSGVTHDKFAGGANGIGKYFTYLANVLEEKLIPSDTIRKNIDGDKWFATKASESDKALINQIKPTLLNYFDSAFDYVQTNLGRFLLLSLMKRNIYSIAVLNEIEKQIQIIKQQNNILHISEFNKMISTIVLNEPAPFIYERIGERYKHFLIDEFQDTSILQWQNLLPLLENSLAEGNFNMIVGDGKQAIYRWRGGEVEQFSKLPEVHNNSLNPLIKQREEILKRSHAEKYLRNNFRSKAEIVDFNNKFFRMLSEKLDQNFKGIYNDLEQQFNPENKDGYVSIEFLKGDEEAGEDLYVTNCKRTKDIIHDLQKKNYNLKDIAILVRKNSDASLIAQYLATEDIDVVSSESLLINQSSKVRLVVAVLKYALKEDNRIARAEVIKFLVEQGKLSEELYHERIAERDSRKFKGLLTDLNINLDFNQLLTLSLYEACEEIINSFYLNTVADPYLQFFLDAALNFSIKKNNNIIDFLEWWEEKKNQLSIVIPEGMNAVRIMSIHKSKGLEFPVVIFPFANWDISKPSKDNLWIKMDEEGIPLLKSALVPVNKSLENTEYAAQYTEEKNKTLLDHLNVLYVALTRPEKQLYILTSHPSARKNLSKYFIEYIDSTFKWEESVSTYSFGVLIEEKKSDSTTSGNYFTLNSFNSSGWRNKLRISTTGVKAINTNVEKQKEYGVFIHDILSKIKTVDDIENALSDLIYNGSLSEADKAELEHKVRSLISNPSMSSFFKTGITVKNECDILLPTGEIIRPDRVVIDGNHATVIDYKTGLKRKNHEAQLQKYADALLQMGYQKIKKFLIFIEEGKVEEIT